MFMSKYRTTLVFLSFPIIMLFLLGPAEIYYSNRNEFSFSLFDFTYIFIGLAIVLLLIGSLLISFMPKTIHKYLMGITFAVSIVMYIQNLLLNKGIFKQDGGPVDWTKLRGYAIVNILIWIVIIGLVLFNNVLLLFVLFKLLFLKVAAFGWKL